MRIKTENFYQLHYDYSIIHDDNDDDSKNNQFLIILNIVFPILDEKKKVANDYKETLFACKFK